MKTISKHVTPRRRSRRSPGTPTRSDVRLVRELMTRKPVVLRADDTLAFARQAMLWGGFRHLPVAREGTLVGVISERELIAAAYAHGAERAGAMKASEVMRHGVQTVSPDEPLTDASARMIAGAIGALPVIERGEIVGILTLTDLLADSGLGPRGPETSAHAVTARVLMTTTPVLVKEDDSIFDVAARMVEAGIRHVPVIDYDGRLVGIVTDRDVRAIVGVPQDALRQRQLLELESLKVSEVMSRDPVRVELDATIGELVDILADERIGAVPVVDEREQPVGIVSVVDLLRHLSGR